ncbi:MAG: dihydrofolate reductase family protein [Pseudomonadota bacterium]
MEAALDLPAAMRLLAKAAVTRVLCEGGAGLAAGLLRAGLVDELALITAGRVIGAEGHPAVGPLTIEALAEAARLVPATGPQGAAERIGPDILTLWRPRPPG